jgi:disulfide bond formation protein DsbB
MTPATLALAAITLMLWILWSDSVRSRRPSPILYTIRIALYLVMSGIFILNLVRDSQRFNGTAMALAIAAALIGVFGAGYFARKLVRRA